MEEVVANGGDGGKIGGNGEDMNQWGGISGGGKGGTLSSGGLGGNSTRVSGLGNLSDRYWDVWSGGGGGGLYGGGSGSAVAYKPENFELINGNAGKFRARWTSELLETLFIVFGYLMPGGGGGSSYVNTNKCTSTPTYTTGVQSGDGAIRISNVD